MMVQIWYMYIYIYIFDIFSETPYYRYRLIEDIILEIYYLESHKIQSKIWPIDIIKVLVRQFQIK